MTTTDLIHAQASLRQRCQAIRRDIKTASREQNLIELLIAKKEQLLKAYVPEFSHAEFREILSKFRQRSPRHEIIIDVMESEVIQQGGRLGVSKAGLVRLAQERDPNIKLKDVKDLLEEEQRAFLEFV